MVKIYILEVIDQTSLTFDDHSWKKNRIRKSLGPLSLLKSENLNLEKIILGSDQRFWGKIIQSETACFKEMHNFL